MNRKVEVVFTGGTIGSESSAGTIATATAPPSALLDSVATENVDWSRSEPFRILSEDATSTHWEVLARHVAALDFRRLDAVVVTHGSDTLAWTAKALAFALAGVPKPVVLVGADKPLSDPSSNGIDNFRDAVAFALDEGLPGVHLAWRNPREETSIHLAGRILPCDSYDDHFRSVGGARLGCVAKGGFQRGNHPANPTRSALAGRAGGESWERSRSLVLAGASFDPGVLVLPACPGADLSHVDPSRWKAIVQATFHSGTAPSVEGPGSLVDLARRARSVGTPLYLGPCRSSRVVYESVHRVSQVGLATTPAMEFTSLVVKLRWLLGAGFPLADLDRDLAWEILPETIFQR